MPAGEDQRMRLKVNDARFLWLICQSSLGKMMFCAPVRGTIPSMLFRPVNPLLQSPAATGALARVLPPATTRVARVPNWEEAVQGVSCPGTKVLPSALQLGAAKNTLGLLATAVPGKFR